jgi:hypothetical protein
MERSASRGPELVGCRPSDRIVTEPSQTSGKRERRLPRSKLAS